MSYKDKPSQELIGQGTYGCVFKPGFTCGSKSAKSKKFVSKIQRKEKTSSSETLLGKKIKKIPHYTQYFAPILSTCTISLAKLDSNEVSKCEFIADEHGNTLTNTNSREYESNKLKYVGKESLQEFLLNKYLKNAKNITMVILRSHSHLLTAIHLLNQSKIIHFDLKENNIKCVDETGTPILIDFGLSLDLTDPSVFKTIRFDSVYYFPWPLDVSLLNKYNNDPKTSITESFIAETIEEFLKKSYTESILTKDEIKEFKQKQMTYYKSFVGKPFSELNEEIKKYVMTWDHYSLSWIYTDILKTIFFSLDLEDEQLTKYRNYLTSIITSIPPERPLPETARSYIQELFKQMTKTSLHKIHKSFSIITKETREQVKTQLKKRKYQLLQTKMKKQEK